MNLCCRPAAVAALSLVFTATALADHVVTYGDFDGPTVMYTDVTESSSSGHDPVFGAPNLDINQLDFNPNQSFLATASDDSLPGATNGQLEFMLMSKAPKSSINRVDFSEGGRYSLGGAPGFAQVSASLEVTITILEINGASPSTPILPIIDSTTFSTDLDTTGDISDARWTTSLVVNLDPYLTGAGYDPATSAVTKLALVIDNDLSAVSDIGTSATISKDDFKVTPRPNELVIPEPASAAFVGLGLIGLAARRRRRA